MACLTANTILMASGIEDGWEGGAMTVTTPFSVAALLVGDCKNGVAPRLSMFGVLPLMLLFFMTSATDLPFQPSYEQGRSLELPMSTVVSLLVLTSMIGIMNNHSLRQRR